MTEELLDPTDEGAEDARAHLQDAITAAVNGEPRPQPVPVVDEVVQPPREVLEAQEALIAREALKAAVGAAEVLAPEPVEIAVVEEPALAEVIAIAPAGEQSPDEAPEASVAEEPVAVAQQPAVIAEVVQLEAAPAEPEAVEQAAEEVSLDAMIESLDADADADADAGDAPAAVAVEAEAPAAATVEAAQDPQAAAAAPVVAPQPAPELVAAPVEAKVASWPFITYLGAWAVFAAVLVWQFLQLPASVATFDSPLYGYSIVFGLVLAVTGPVVAIVTWLNSWSTPGATKSDLLVSALVKGSIVTFCGVGIWWLAYIVIDQIRLGRILSS